MRGWSSATVSGNTIYGSAVAGKDNNGVVDIISGPATSRSYTFNDNTYYYSGASLPFIYDTARDFSTWEDHWSETLTLLTTAARPTGIKVFVRPTSTSQGERTSPSTTGTGRAASMVNLSQAGLSNGQNYEM